MVTRYNYNGFSRKIYKLDNDKPLRFLRRLEKQEFTGVLEAIVEYRGLVYEIRLLYINGLITSIILYMNNFVLKGWRAVELIRRNGLFQEDCRLWVDVTKKSVDDIIIEDMIEEEKEGTLLYPLRTIDLL